MKTAIILIRIGGVFNVLFGILHIAFWNLFDWSEELSKLSLSNSNIMQMLNLFSIIVFFYTAFILLFIPAKLLSNSSGRLFIGMFVVLYLSRLVMEFYFPNGSIGFGILMVVTILLFALPLVQAKQLSHAN